MSIDRSRTALIHLARKRLGLDEAAYRDLLLNAAGVSSSADLDERGFTRVMEAFERLGFVSTARKRTYGARPGMATPAQLTKIRVLWSQFTGGAGDDISLGQWLKGKWGVEHPRFLPGPEAHKAIGALSRMVQRRTGATG